MKFLAYIFILFMVVSCNSQIARLSGSQSTNSVEKDKTHLIIYPWNRSDTLNYADLRFLRLVYAMDTDNVYNYNHNQIDFFTYHLEDSVRKTSLTGVKKGTLSIADVHHILDNRFQRLTIDSVYYQNDSVRKQYYVGKEYVVDYTNKTYCEGLEDTLFLPSEHVNSLGSINAVLKMDHSKKWRKVLHPNGKIPYFDMSLHFDYRCPFMNLGDLPRINEVLIQDIEGGFIYKSQFDGRNQRIESFFDVSPYSKQDLWIKVRGRFNYDLHLIVRME